MTTANQASPIDDRTDTGGKPAGFEDPGIPGSQDAAAYDAVAAKRHALAAGQRQGDPGAADAATADYVAPQPATPNAATPAADAGAQRHGDAFTRTDRTAGHE